MQQFREQLSRNEMLVAAGLVFFVSFLAYLWTLAPTVTLVDSGELIVAARFLGVAHPPGFPLYLILAHPFFTHIAYPASSPKRTFDL
jgi:hypothetical protein